MDCETRNGMVRCTCSVEGVELGSCDAPDLSFRLYGSCCEQFY